MSKKKKTAEELKKKYAVLKDPITMTLHLPAGGLEPTYYWLTDFLESSGYELDKTQESMAAAVASSFFSDLGAKKTRMEQAAREIMGNINTVVKSIVNLVYDLKEFDRRLEIFDDIHSSDKEKKEAGEVAIKSVWMDEVDVKRGMGSINQLAASPKMEFVTLRDAFLQAKNVKDVKNMDLNNRVKRIVKSRIEEYEKWRNKYEKDLRQRRKIELAYLKSQVHSLKEYSSWARPYLIAAQKLRKNQKLGKNMPEFFDTSKMNIVMKGKKQIKGPQTHQDLQLGLFKRKDPYGDLEPMYSVIELDFSFSSKPALVARGEGNSYRHVGVIKVKFSGYALTEEENKRIDEEDMKESLKLAKSIENMTKESLEAVAEDIEEYLNEKEEKKDETLEIFAFLKPLKDLNDFVLGMFKPLSYIIPKEYMPKHRKSKYKMNVLRKEAKKKAEKDVQKIFEIYRKANGYLAAD